MKNQTIEVITDESRTWVIVRRNNKVIHEAHSISIIDFCWILKELGHNVKDIEIPDEQMEQQTF